MNKIITLLTIILPGLFLIVSDSNKDEVKTKNLGTIYARSNGNAEDDEASGRWKWEFDRLKDPATGTIPHGMRRLELAFAKKLPKAPEFSKDVVWVNRGPWNVGGRTRAAALDIMNEGRIFAGGVSGGLWHSEDAGQSWSIITPSDQLLCITCIAQDCRQGMTNTWYYGTGEFIGNSASAAYSAWYSGNGIYKSTDNGITWQSLESTASNSPESLNYPWDFTWNIITDASTDTADIIYVAGFGSIMRSGDGGNSWTTELGNQDCYFTDVAITSTGVVYATLSSESNKKGIWRSANGLDWTKILPVDSFPVYYYRIVIGINPSNENIVYFLAETPGSGLLTHNFYGDALWHSLWRYTYLTGDGAGANGIWEDLSMNLPATGTSMDQFNTQGSYDMVIRVKPDDPNVVFIGATNVYRSTDGFSSPDNTTQIGGYTIGSYIPHWSLYPNHHPDQHVFLFLPSNADVLITGNDGGMYRTNNCTDSIVVWEKLNRGYITSQLYTVGADLSDVNDIVVTGFQDNGNFFTSSPDPTATWTMPLNGDGSFMGITNGGDYYYLSIQNGKIYKMALDENGLPTGFSRIDPIGGEDYEFINPLVLDPNNNDIMYVAGGHKLWRNNILSQLPLVNNYDSISTGWSSFSYNIPGYITSLAVSRYPSNVVYCGTNGKHIYRFDNASQGDPEPVDLLYYKFPAARANCVAVDPRDASKIIVVFSNYKVYSLFYSDDSGANWKKGAGNLEANEQGSGNGPSLRWVSVMPVGSETLYFLGTSVGLFATSQLDSTATQWIQVGVETIGNTVVDMVVTRETDGLVLVATHGRGLFSAHVTSVEDIIPAGINENSNADLHARIFPNPTDEKSVLSLSLPWSGKVVIELYDKSGRFIKSIARQYMTAGKNQTEVSASDLSAGIYFCRIQTGNTNQIVKLAVIR
jgi:hypothetical protein